MHRAAAVSLALLLGSTVLAAQTTIAQKDIQKTAVNNQNQVRTTVVHVSRPASSCPISLYARQVPAGDMMEVNGVRFKEIAQFLHLTVAAPNSKRIVEANVTVRGFANKARLLQTMSNQDSSDAAKTLDVRFPAGPGEEVSADLSVPGLSAVSAIDLNSVTYADGSTWKLVAGSSCRSWIDGIMLVSSH
jgi:hypothetical protein